MGSTAVRARQRTRSTVGGSEEASLEDDQRPGGHGESCLPISNNHWRRNILEALTKKTHFCSVVESKLFMSASAPFSHLLRLRLRP